MRPRDAGWLRFNCRRCLLHLFPAARAVSAAVSMLLNSECLPGVHSCFHCKKPEGPVRRCHVPHCGKFYHEACARLNPLTVFDNKGFRCPLHTCLGCCCSSRTKHKSSNGEAASPLPRRPSPPQAGRPLTSPLPCRQANALPALPRGVPRRRPVRGRRQRDGHQHRHYLHQPL